MRARILTSPAIGRRRATLPHKQGLLFFRNFCCQWVNKYVGFPLGFPLSPPNKRLPSPRDTLKALVNGWSTGPSEMAGPKYPNVRRVHDRNVCMQIGLASGAFTKYGTLLLIGCLLVSLQIRPLNAHVWNSFLH